jgi:hypothetical protein
VLSVALEAAILAAMLVWPLITPGVLTAHYIVTPARATASSFPSLLTPNRLMFGRCHEAGK